MCGVCVVCGVCVMSVMCVSGVCVMCVVCVSGVPVVCDVVCFRDRLSLCCAGWNALVGSQLTATSASWVQVTLLPQPPM